MNSRPAIRRNGASRIRRASIAVLTAALALGIGARTIQSQLPAATCADAPIVAPTLTSGAHRVRNDSCVKEETVENVARTEAIGRRIAFDVDTSNIHARRTHVIVGAVAGTVVGGIVGYAIAHNRNCQGPSCDVGSNALVGGVVALSAIGGAVLGGIAGSLWPR
jgi:hypothetical protein